MDLPKSSTGRVLQLTEKGAQYQADVKRKLYKECVKLLTAAGTSILEAIARGDRSLVQTEFDTWKHRYIEFVQSHQVLYSLLDEKERDELQVEHDSQLKLFNTWKAEFESFLRAHPAQQKSRSSSECGSRKSGASQAVRDKLFLMKVEEMKLIAEKDVKASMASKQLELQRKREKIEREMAQEQEMLDQEMDRKMSEARMKILCSVEESEVPVGDDVDDVGHPDASQSECEQAEKSKPTTKEDPVMMLMMKLMEQKKSGDLPILEPEVFKGDVARFSSWLNSFETHIESKTESPVQRLHFLAKYTGGEARRTISGFLQLRSDDSYKLAKEKLVDRYGNDFIVANAFRSKIREWPVIKAGDGRGLRDFADHLEHCLAAASTSVKNLSVLDDHLENEVMLRKLPKHLVDRWKRIVDDWVYGDKSGDGIKYPPFTEFVRFISVEARIACGPVGDFRDHGDSPSQASRESASSRRKLKKVSGEARAFSASTEQPAMKKCVKCQGDHMVTSCKQVMSMPLQERNKMVADLRLCRGCLKKGHLWRNCLRKARCDTCGRQHPTLLHNPELAAQETVETAATCLQSVSNSCHCLVIPVLLSSKEHPRKKVLVYALLDAQSDTCFISRGSCAAINAKGRRTKLELSTIAGRSTINSEAVEDLVIQPLTSEEYIQLPVCYSRASIPCSRLSIPRKETALKWKHLEGIADLIPDYYESAEIGLLLGTSCAKAIKPYEVRPGEDDEPWAVRTILGWGIIGSTRPEDGVGMCRRVVLEDGSTKVCHFSFRTAARESPSEVLRVLERDFEDSRESSLGTSVEDREFLNQVRAGFRRSEDGHVQMPLPLRQQSIFPNNRSAAEKRLKALKSRLLKGGKYRDDYIEFMDGMLKKGYAEAVEEDEGPEGRTWYLAHHGVYHPRKHKLRIVFDCSSEFQGLSLNKCLLQGPDLTNSLTGILCRFRKEPVAVSCDVEGMFNQVSVSVEDRDLLRFLWWEEGDLKQAPKVYRMTTHLFGARSSPACAMFALRSAAEECDEEASQFIKRDFYIDDGLTSTPDETTAVRLINSAKSACEARGFHLHKFASNKTEVLQSIDKEKGSVSTSRQKNVKLDEVEELPMQSVLGVQWNTEDDTFAISVSTRLNRNRGSCGRKSVSRRSILSVVSSVFDPLGFVSPYVLFGKLLLRELCRDGLSWDEPVSEDVARVWSEWLDDMSALEDIRIPRGFSTDGLRSSAAVELHHFADASLDGYGQCSYLRTVEKTGEVSTALVMSKARVAPSKPITVPRLELTAAVLAVKISQFLHAELDLEVIQECFWTDSKIVLGYIANDARRFHIFVANRVQYIREHTSPSQWRYVRSDENPADIASRGSKAAYLTTNSLWWHGPEFLREPELHREQECVDVDPDDKELKRTTVLKTAAEEKHASLTERLEYFSDWYRAKRAVAICLLYVRTLLDRVRRKKEQDKETADRFRSPLASLKVDTLQKAERIILKAAQEEEKFLNMLDMRPDDKGEDVIVRGRKGTALSGLDPFVRDGLLRVGGRLKHSNLSDDEVHPVILPNRSPVTSLVIQHHHEEVGHAGRQLTLNQLRMSGYWVVGARRAVSRHIMSCVTCRKLRGRPQQQKMADLPQDRLQEAAPFTYSAVDCFGPFYVKEKRSQVKRWGVLFTCLCSRAIHIETVNSLSADSFLNAFRRFVARRGPVSLLRCDRGTNFVGGRSELENAISEMGPDRLKRGLLHYDCEMTEFDMNVPRASHMGGVWERMIRSARAALDGILKTQYQQGGFDDELLRTFLTEAEAIVNSRPLAGLIPSESSEPQPISPMQILTLKSRVALPPPGVFLREDVYSRRRWRRVQALADLFWRRWRADFLPTLQQRRKWTETKPNLEVGDVVLVVDDDAPRGRWPLGRVLETHKSDDGLVRKVTLRVRGNIYVRPIHRLVRLMTE